MELAAKEELILKAKEDYGITYGLRFKLPDDVPHSYKKVGGIKVKVYDETPAGELILRTLATRANDSLIEKQNSFMFESAAEVFRDFPDAFENFEDAYASLSKVPENATKYPDLILRYRDIQRAASKQMSAYTEELRRMSDLIFCYFLTLHTDKEWELEDLYSLGTQSKGELSEFMIEQIGLKSAEDEEDGEPSEEAAVEEAAKENTPSGGKSLG